jgi:hypothetical protein
VMTQIGKETILTLINFIGILLQDVAIMVV